MRKSYVSLLLAFVLALSLVAPASAFEEVIRTSTITGPVVRYFTNAGYLGGSYYNMYLSNGAHYYIPGGVSGTSSYTGGISTENYTILLRVNTTVKIKSKIGDWQYPDENSSNFYATKLSNTTYNFYSSIKYRYYLDVPNLPSSVTVDYRFCLNDTLG